MSQNKWLVDIDSWVRKDAWQFFKDYQDPFFNISTRLDVGPLVNYSKSTGQKFNLRFLHILISSIHEVPEFCMRIEDDKVWQYRTLKCGITVKHEDGRFSFTYLPFYSEPHEFVQKSDEHISLHKQSADLRRHSEEQDKVHVSILPWIHFSAVKHPRKKFAENAIPIFTIGKYHRSEEKTWLPFSIEAHHALVDGWHAAILLEKIQEKLFLVEE